VSYIRLIPAAFIAVCVLSAVAASTASAGVGPHWRVLLDETTPCKQVVSPTLGNFETKAKCEAGTEYKEAGYASGWSRNYAVLCVKVPSAGEYETEANCVNGVGLGSSFTPGWDRIPGKAVNLAEGEILKLKTHNVSGVPTIIGLGLAKVECKTAEGLGQIDGASPGEDSAGITLTGCVVPGFPACKVNSEEKPIGTIGFGTLAELIYATKVDAEKLEGAVLDLLRPINPPVFTRVEVTGTSCPVSGTYKIEGSAAGELFPAAGKFAEAVKLVFPSSTIAKAWKDKGGGVAEEVKIGLVGGTITGEDEVELENKSSFGVSDT
jgi:hypothetical protein